MNARPETRFDRDWSLEELLQGMDTAGLERALRALCGGATVRLRDPQGRTLLGPETPLQRAGRACVRLGPEIEPWGVLEIEAAAGESASRFEAAGWLLTALIRAEQRYRMVSTLHEQAVQQDYEALQRKHAALQESEARYRQLCAELQQRVTEQVSRIDEALRRLYRLERSAAIGTLAAGMAHEINNPIGFIKSNLNTARRYVEDLARFVRELAQGDDAARQAAWRESGWEEMIADFSALLTESLAGVERIARLVADLRGFAGIDGPPEQLQDLNALIERVCQIARVQIRDRARIVFAGAALPPVRCQPAALSQALLNMLLNAAEAMDRPGEIRVSTELASGGDWVRIRIADEGRGIPPEVLPRIFDPFFTTKDVNQGTGLGLTVAQDVVREHGGRIQVDSTVGRGTVFTVELPAGR